MQDTTESITITNEQEEPLTIMVEPINEPYVLAPGRFVEIEFEAGRISGNLNIALRENCVLIEEIGPPYSGEIRYHGNSDDFDTQQSSCLPSRLQTLYDGVPWQIYGILKLKS